MLRNKQVHIILATQSQARQDMLRGAGVKFSVLPAMLDEMAVARAMPELETAPQKIALELAKKKALTVAHKNPESLVIGSGQVLVLDGKLMGKAKNVGEAREKLKSLRGKTHSLVSSVAVAKENQILWSYEAEAKLTMKNFDDKFLDDYCAKAGDALRRAVGAYEFEGLGAWLFSEVTGDYYTILGMPLLPLLTYLHDAHGVRI